MGSTTFDFVKGSEAQSSVLMICAEHQCLKKRFIQGRACGVQFMHEHMI